MNSIATQLKEKFQDVKHLDSLGQDVFYVSSENYLDIVAFLKNDCEITMCVDITVVDYLECSDRQSVEGIELERFEVVANFISHKRNQRVRLIVQLQENDPSLDSISKIFPGANFAEREVYDMYGIEFNGHPDLTRILMPEEWIGHPLRKDDSPARIPVNFTDDISNTQESFQ